ncbi:MAG: cobalamin biosynthesis central domain-containing protein [Clostridium sp.]
MKLAGIAFTERGARLLERLLSRFQEEGEEIEGTVSPSCAEAAGGLSIRRETLKEWTKRQFQQADGLIFVGAAGIAVRACAPFVQDKTKDPAVIVIDETGRYAVSLLSGHLGGANELALRAASIIGAEPVITTATDRNGLLAPDVFAKENGLEIEDMGLAREAAAALLRGEHLGFFSDFPVEGTIPAQMAFGKACRLNLWITRAGNMEKAPDESEEKKQRGLPSI